jgi:hypothetical protein
MSLPVKIIGFVALWLLVFGRYVLRAAREWWSRRDAPPRTPTK